MNIAPIADPLIHLQPSNKLVEFLKTVNPNVEIPFGIKKFVFKNTSERNEQRSFQHKIFPYTDDEISLVNSLQISNVSHQTKSCNVESVSNTEKTLTLEDLYWLYDYIQNHNKSSDKKVYLHELVAGSNVILPKNVEIPRSKVLDARCKRLRDQQQNHEYNRITKNVDNLRRKLPEDTIAYQVKQINRHLIAVFQFIVSVLTGFAFGFLGLELIIGNLDFGFRLLLGIICALVIALAELYFLAKKLNEDLQFEMYSNRVNRKTVKTD